MISTDVHLVSVYTSIGVAICDCCVQNVVAINWVLSVTPGVTSKPANVAVNVTLLVDSATSAWPVILLTYFISLHCVVGCSYTDGWVPARPACWPAKLRPSSIANKHDRR